MNINTIGAEIQRAVLSLVADLPTCQSSGFHREDNSGICCQAKSAGVMNRERLGAVQPALGLTFVDSFGSNWLLQTVSKDFNMDLTNM